MPLASRTLPVATAGGGISATGVLSLPGVEAACIHVDKGPATGTEDGTRQDPFHTVAAGIAAAALIANVNNPVVILVYPGEYAEDGLIMGTDYVSLVGIGGKEAVRIEGSNQTVLSITADIVTVWGITFAQTLAATDIVNITTASSVQAELHECGFETNAAGSQPVRVNNGGALFKDCTFAHSALSALAHRTIFETGNSSNNVVTIDGCTFVGNLTLDESEIRIEHCRLETNSPTAGIVLTLAGEFRLRHCEIDETTSDCLQFQSQPNAAILQDNRLNANAGSYDVNATLAVTGFVIEGNSMFRGIHGNISHLCSIRYVGNGGAYKEDYYASLQFALDSCTFDDCVIKLLDNLTLTAAATPPSRPVTVDGNGYHSITRAGAALFTVGASDDLTVVDARLVGTVDVAGNAAVLQIERCSVTGMVDVQSGDASTSVSVVRSYIYGEATNSYGIRIADADPFIYVKRSYVKGDTSGAGAAAIIYDAGVTNNNLKIEHSTIWHGGGGANLPITRSAAQTPDYCSHHDAYNTDPLAGGWLTNLIAAAQRYNAYDVQTDY